MNNRMIEEKLNTAITNETPDILESLMSECAFSEQDAQVNYKTIRPKRKLYRIIYAIPAAVAVVLMVFGVLFISNNLKSTSAESATSITAPSADIEIVSEELPVATVCFDINPSIEITISEVNRVLECRGINKEGQEILKEIDLRNADIKVASYAIIGVMYTKGYFTKENNSLLVSVISEDFERGNYLETDLTQAIYDYTDNFQAKVAVLGLSAQEDDVSKNMADINQISEGKASLIQYLLAKNERYTEEDLLKLSTQELLLIYQTNLVEETDALGSIYGEVSTDQYISTDDARNAALVSIGARSDEVIYDEIEFDCDKGIIVYEVTIRTGNAEYEVEVNAVTGDIVESELNIYYSAESQTSAIYNHEYDYPDDEPDNDIYETDDDYYEDNGYDHDDDYDDDFHDDADDQYDEDIDEEDDDKDNDDHDDDEDD